MNIKDFFWWLGPVRAIVIEPFWWAIVIIVVFSVGFLRIWWWLICPIVLFFALWKFYRWWIGWDKWYGEKKWIMLEITPPKEVLTPFKAMEDVFSVIWTVYDDANWREQWCEGELPMGPFWFSFEIASFEGEIHFYIRCLEEHRHIVESVLYSHYPETEISEVPDYTKNVPQDIPNTEWDIYGSDFEMMRENAYPIKTYEKFFEPTGERITKEEKRIDPIVSLLEDMGRLGPGEQVWFQIVAVPITDKEIPWVTEGKKIVAKMARRAEKKPASIIGDIQGVIRDLVFGPKTTEEAKKEKFLPPGISEETMREMVITPGEREVLTGIEEKIKKQAFKTNIRGVYVAKRSAYKMPHRKIVESYFPHFYTQNLNVVKYGSKTRTKVHYVWRGRRVYVRARKMFRHYIQRFPPFYPKLTGWGNFILNTEELTTIYHFPTKIGALTVPTVKRVEVKKGGPPAELPTE